MEKKMTRETTTRMLGCARFEARWIGDSQMVELTARGFLPCASHHAQLEKRVGAVWELVFYTQETGDEFYTPFCLHAKVLVADARDTLIVIDALGEHEIAIQPAEKVEPDADGGSYIVYARKTAIDVPDETYFTLPVGTKVLPIYSRAFGPAGKNECRAFIAMANDKFMVELDELHAKIERVEVGED